MHSLRSLSYRYALGLNCLQDTPKPTQLRIKGGIELTLQNVAPYLKTLLISRLKQLHEVSPFTFFQIMTGIALHIGSSLGIYRISSLLFHSRLVLAPFNEVHRGVTAFAVLGLSWWDVISRSITLMLYQSPLETHLNSDSNSMPGSFPSSPKISNGILSKATRFAMIQATLCALIVGLEVTLFHDSYASSQGGFTQLFPYTLYPILEQVNLFLTFKANRWLWAMTTHESSKVMVMGVSLQPIHVPLVMMFLGGAESIVDGLKGLAVSVAVGQIWEIKRWNGSLAIDWFVKTVNEWNVWINKLL